MKKIIKIFDAFVALVVVATMSITGYYNSILPNNITIYNNESIKFNTALEIKGTNLNETGEVLSAQTSTSEYNSELKLFGLVPVKTITVSKVNEQYVALSGECFGIKIFTKGVMIVGMTDVAATSGSINPAKSAGLKLGDIILQADGKKLTSNQQLSKIISKSNGKLIDFKVKRDNRIFDIKFKTVYSVESKSYKAGIWVRDSTAGIGTMTFYSNVNGAFAGLGHAVLDVDTNLLLPINSGEAVKTEIISVVKGKQGAAGELCGAFTSESIGTIQKNTTNGLYGFLNNYIADKLIKVASDIDVSTGSAKIISSIDENGPKYYNCEIISVDYNNDSQKNLLIKVTDKELLNKTGGIVQGMSGSPIVQNGELVGAVTHVFLNDPTRGYGVFANTMLEEMNRVS